jgi:hypothetical protein
MDTAAPEAAAAAPDAATGVAAAAALLIPCPDGSQLGGDLPMDAAAALVAAANLSLTKFLGSFVGSPPAEPRQHPMSVFCYWRGTYTPQRSKYGSCSNRKQHRPGCISAVGDSDSSRHSGARIDSSTGFWSRLSS